MFNSIFLQTIFLTGLSQACSLKMVYITLLYLEMIILLLFMLVAMVVFLDYILFNFSSKYNLSSIKVDQDIISLLDVAFVILPTMMVFYMIIPAVGFIYSYDGFTVYSEQTLLNINITGRQWYWAYEIFYESSHPVAALDLNITHSFDSMLTTEKSGNRLLQVDHPLVIPTGVPANVYITSADVIHSWSVPALGVKIDAVPGRIQSFTLTSDVDGSFYGQCSELCGVHHARMPIHVVSVPKEEFEIYLIIASKTDFLTPFFKFLESDSIYYPKRK